VVDKFNAQDITYIPIVPDRARMEQYLKHDFCITVFEVYEQFYRRAGVVKPWTGYFAVVDEDVVGVGGFKGNGDAGQVEIAYGTVPEYEGRGVSSRTCRFLTDLALKHAPAILITARTLRYYNASTAILEKNGFVLRGEVEDPEDGLVWEWIYPSQD
jgi:RimJ/RimL family protein N-acetyltransferase